MIMRSSAYQDPDSLWAERNGLALLGLNGWMRYASFLTKGRKTLSLLKQSWPSAINASQLKKCWNQLGRLRYCWRQNRSDWKFRTSAITDKRFGQAEGQSQTDNCLQTQLEILWYSHWELDSGRYCKNSDLNSKWKTALSTNINSIYWYRLSWTMWITSQ